MSRVHVGIGWMLVLVVALATSGAAAEAADRPPNVVFVLVDDMGWGDLPSQHRRVREDGSVVPARPGWAMPNLARLEREGTRFTHFSVAQAVCSASRAAFLTGCWPNRLGIHGALGPNARHGIADAETTLAEALRAEGYATACFGKWHLGHRPRFLPPSHGFDEYLGIPYSNDMWPGHPETPKNWPPLPLIEGAEPVEIVKDLADQGELTRRFTERAVDFIARHADRPFLLYLPHPQPHVPLATSEAFTDVTRDGAYGDVMAELDWSVGELLRTLDVHGLAADTIVVFTSDNGPWLSYGHHAGTTGGLREGKGTSWEGGLRVPMLVRWPGRVPAGRVSDVRWNAIDLLPTLLEAVGTAAPDGIDGASALAVWTGASDDPPREADWLYYHTNELHFVRTARWKLALPHRYRTMDGRWPGFGGRPGRYTHRRTELELYDLANDPHERTNLATARPDVVEMMMAHVAAARADLGDRLVEAAGTGRREPGRVPPDED